MLPVCRPLRAHSVAPWRSSQSWRCASDISWWTDRSAQDANGSEVGSRRGQSFRISAQADPGKADDFDDRFPERGGPTRCPDPWLGQRFVQFPGCCRVGEAPEHL